MAYTIDSCHQLINKLQGPELLEGRLALTMGYILTRVSFSFYQKHFLGQFSLFFLEYPITKL